MTENEILEGLREAKEKEPNTTIGNAVELMMGLDLFWYDKYLTEGNIVSANIPQDCRYNVADVAGIVGIIDSMVRERKVILLGEDMNYGKPTEHDLKRLSTPGSIFPIQGSDIKTWKMLSNRYEVNNI